MLRRYAGTYQRNDRRDRVDTPFIADEREWGAVCQILCGKAVRPPVDFSKEIVLLAINSDENYVSTEALLSANGDLELQKSVTLMHCESPTLGTYVFSVISREGINTIHGEPVRTGIWRFTTRRDLPLRWTSPELRRR